MDPVIQELQDTVTNLSGRLEQLETNTLHTISMLESKIRDLDSSVYSLESKISSLESTVSSLNRGW